MGRRWIAVAGQLAAPGLAAAEFLGKATARHAEEAAAHHDEQPAAPSEPVPLDSAIGA